MNLQGGHSGISHSLLVVSKTCNQATRNALQIFASLFWIKGSDDMTNGTSCNGLEIGLGVVHLRSDNGMLQIKRNERAVERRIGQTRQTKENTRKQGTRRCFRIEIHFTQIQ